ncbi:MAG: radical SAM protein [Paracoccaceae bacterium]
MFRLTQYMRELIHPTPVRRREGPVKPVVIWNLTRRCNLKCRHCYTTSADVHFPGELSHEQAMGVLDDLKAFGIPALILSGGEPLSRFDFFELAERAKELNFRHLSLSTNGTLIDASNAQRIADLGFDYVGISLDGIGKTNDWFRGLDGAYDAALTGVRELLKRDVKVGLRFTITEDNAHHLPEMMDLCDREGVDKFYLCRTLVYAGRGDKHRGDDTEHNVPARRWTKAARPRLVAVAEDMPLEIVTGNKRRRRGLFPALGGKELSREGRSYPRPSRSLGRQQLGAGRGQYRHARQGASRYLLVGLYRGFGQDDALLRSSGRARTRCWPRCASVRARSRAAAAPAPTNRSAAATPVSAPCN